MEREREGKKERKMGDNEKETSAIAQAGRPRWPASSGDCGGGGGGGGSSG